MPHCLSRAAPILSLLCGVVVLVMVVMGWTRYGIDSEPDWAIPAPSPTPSPNGYSLYVAAANAIIPASPAVDEVNDRAPVTDSKSMAARYSLARRTAWAQQNSRAWVLFERAKTADSMHPLDRAEGSVSSASYGRLRDLARCKVVVANTAKMRGDWDSAAKNGLDAIEMGGDVGRGAPLLGFLVSEALESIGTSSCRDIPEHLDGKESRQAARRLEKLLATRPALADVMREEKWAGMTRLRDYLRTRKWRRASAWTDSVKSGTASLSDVVKLQFLSKTQIFESYSRAAELNITTVQEPYIPSSKPFLTPGQKADNLINEAYNPWRWSVKFNAARNDTLLSLLLLRFALRAYRVEKGQYPTTLSQLAPTYITAIPMDPFGNGMPLHYVKKGNNYRLWSIGADAKDDGGRAIPLTGRQKKMIILPALRGDIVATPKWK